MEIKLPDKQYEIYAAHIDDDPCVLACTNRLMQKRNIWTYQLYHPSQGLKDFDYKVNLIISDGDGVIADVINQRDMYMPETPILLCTGNPSIISNYRLSHNIPGINKPFTAMLLEEMIRQYAK